MMFVGLIMRPWIILMESCLVACFILADGVLILAHGDKMLDRFTNALNNTHNYLQAMGARVPP